MRDENAVNRPVGGNGNIVNDPVNRIAKEFETGNECNIEITARQLSAQRCRMIKHNFTRPAENEWARVEIFDAADAERFQISWRARWSRPGG